MDARPVTQVDRALGRTDTGDMATFGEFDMQAAWERAGSAYRTLRGDDASEVSYGALSPGESTLQLLGDLQGQTVLDLGCGGGHNAVACARAGAVVTGLDLSADQLSAARRLADAHGVSVTWLHGDAAGAAVGRGYRWALALQVLGYVDDLAGALAICRQALAVDGRLVVSIDHPLRTCFIDTEDGDMAGVPLTSYFFPKVLAWQFDTGMPMRVRHMPMGSWMAAFGQAGFRVERLLEPATPADLAGELWPEDSPLAPLALIPHTAIFVLAPMI